MLNGVIQKVCGGFAKLGCPLTTLIEKETLFEGIDECEWSL